MALQVIKLLIQTGKYRFYHALLVIAEDEIISIPLLKQDDYIAVEEYLLTQNISVDSLPKFHKLIYGYENIDMKEGK